MIYKTVENKYKLFAALNNGLDQAAMTNYWPWQKNFSLQIPSSWVNPEVGEKQFMRTLLH